MKSSKAGVSKPNLASHLIKWNDLCTGLMLLYLGPNEKPDEYIDRMIMAMEKDNLDEMNHVSALLLAMMIGRGEKIAEQQQWWEELDKEYHKYFCKDCLAC